MVVCMCVCLFMYVCLPPCVHTYIIIIVCVCVCVCARVRLCARALAHVCMSVLLQSLSEPSGSGIVAVGSAHGHVTLISLPSPSCSWPYNVGLRVSLLPMTTAMYCCLY